MKVTAAALLLSAVVAVGWGAAVPTPAPQEPFYRESLEGAQYQAPVIQYQNPTPRYHAHVQPTYESQPAVYDFQWEVNDDYYGNYYGHREQRDGAVTKGSYYIRLPDTRLMKVEYYADEYGYHPTITYEGEAQYPQPARQSYQALQNDNSQPRDLYL